MSTTIAPKRLRLGPRSAGMPLTTEEFDAVDDCVRGYRYELIRGLLVVSPSASNAEVDPNEYLGYLLRSYCENHPQGAIIDKSLPRQTLYPLKNRRCCDRAIWIGLGRVPDLEKDVPAIVVEFVSRSRRDHRRDYEEKRAEYLALGVAEYWVFDRFRRMMMVYKNAPGGTVEVAVGEAQSYQTDLLPGFVLPMAPLLSQADDWPRKPKARRRPTGEGGSI